MAPRALALSLLIALTGNAAALELGDSMPSFTLTDAVSGDTMSDADFVGASAADARPTVIAVFAAT